MLPSTTGTLHTVVAGLSSCVRRQAEKEEETQRQVAAARLMTAGVNLSLDSQVRIFRFCCVWFLHDLYSRNPSVRRSRTIPRWPPASLHYSLFTPLLNAFAVRHLICITIKFARVTVVDFAVESEATGHLRSLPSTSSALTEVLVPFLQPGALQALRSNHIDFPAYALDCMDPCLFRF